MLGERPSFSRNEAQRIQKVWRRVAKAIRSGCSPGDRALADGWFFHEEDKLGSIESGKLGDLVVLSDDYFDAQKVTDDGIKKMHSVLTVVDGKVVYNTPSL